MVKHLSPSTLGSVHTRKNRTDFAAASLGEEQPHDYTVLLTTLKPTLKVTVSD